MDEHEKLARELGGKALREAARVVTDMQLYGTGFIGPDGRRVDPRRVIDISRPFSVSTRIEYEDPYAKDRLAEHSVPLKGEIVGGRFDGLEIEAAPNDP